MGKKLYVGGLPPEVTDVQLHALFAACGSVASAEVMKEKRTGQSRGFGFVEMSTHEEAQAAVAKLHGAALGGMKLVVNEAKPVPEKPQKGFRGFDGGGYGAGYGGRGGYGGPAANRAGFGGGFNQKGHDRRGGGGGKGG